MQLFFIRHGETTSDIEDRYGGDYDDHLTEKGIEQSKTLATTLTNKGIEVVYASSLIRAQETAEYISNKNHAQVVVESDLRERNQYGILSGMYKTEAKEKYPKEVELLKDRYYTMEGAESYEDFRKRFSAIFERIVSAHDDSIAIVTHGGAFRVLFRDLLKWGELKALGDCACILLEKKGDSFVWVEAINVTPDFPV